MVVFKGFLRVFERSLKWMSGKFPWGFREVSKEFVGSLKMFQESFKGVSRKIEGHFKEF